MLRSTFAPTRIGRVRASVGGAQKLRRVFGGLGRLEGCEQATYSLPSPPKVEAYCGRGIGVWAMLRSGRALRSPSFGFSERKIPAAWVRFSARRVRTRFLRMKVRSDQRSEDHTQGNDGEHRVPLWREIRRPLALTGRDVHFISHTHCRSAVAICQAQFDKITLLGDTRG
jgi:hypothetical protein